MIKTETTIYKKGWRYSHPLAFEQYRTAGMLISGAILVGLSLVDYLTGYEFGFFIFYFIPVAIAAWYGGKTEGIAMAVMSGLFWYLADRLAHHPYTKAYFIYWETFMRLLSFLTTSLTISRIRELVLGEERLLSELIEAKQELEQLKKVSLSE